MADESMDEKNEFEILRNRIEDMDTRLSKLEGLVNPQSPKSIQKKLSLREFILSKKPNSESQVGLLIAYYLEHFEGKTSFIAKDLSDGFRLAKEPHPSNISDIIFKNAKKAYFDQVGGKKNGSKSWTLTNSGIREAEKLTDVVKS